MPCLTAASRNANTVSFPLGVWAIIFKLSAKGMKLCRFLDPRSNANKLCVGLVVEEPTVLNTTGRCGLC